MRWLLLFAAACYRPTPQAGAPCGPGDSCPTGLTCQAGFCGGGPAGDAGDPDATIVPPDGCTTFASQLDTCTTSPGGALTLTGFHTYDTDVHELRDDNNVLIPTSSVVVTGMAGPIDVIVVQDLTVSSTLRVVGDVPFGVVAFGAITVVGVIDANGKSGGGAGHRGFMTCGSALGRSGTTDADGSSAGGGGAHAGDGGEGGEGDENGVVVPAGAGGTAIALPAGPLGGCRGGPGGGDPGKFGSPGQGGGAVYLVAGGPISVTGTIDAGGGGGTHADAPNGAGGGGGSGGMIVLEAASVQVTGILVANGGGGGGGADDVVPNDGADGTDGRRDTQRAAGGDGAGLAEGGTGGSGGALSNINGSISTEAAQNGGGGGGGGCGFIAIGSPAKTTAGALLSPALSSWPSPP